MKYSMPLVHVAADIHPLVAGDAAKRLEQLVAGISLGCDRVDVAFEPPIKSAPGREEGPLIGRDGAEEARAVRLAAEGLTKLRTTSGSARSLFNASSTLDPMVWGFSRVCTVWSSSVRRSPSQFRRKLSAALNTVGMFSSTSPDVEVELARASFIGLAPFVDRS